MGKGLDKTVKEVGFVGGAGPVRDHKGPVGGGGVCESRRGYTGKKVGLRGGRCQSRKGRSLMEAGGQLGKGWCLVM